jgi:hypothetical protein
MWRRRWSPPFRSDALQEILPTDASQDAAGLDQPKLGTRGERNDSDPIVTSAGSINLRRATIADQDHKVEVGVDCGQDLVDLVHVATYRRRVVCSLYPGQYHEAA